MTALELIREGFGVWSDRSLGNDNGAMSISFALLFLFGFLTTAILKAVKIPRAIVADTAVSISAEGREAIDDANIARLFELESELTASNDALKSFTETLSTIFANMHGGLAIFDADKSLFLFNPALTELLDLDPVLLARRPSISDFIGMLREKRHLPEKRNFLAWRRLLTGLQESDPQSIYKDEWILLDGRILHVAGQPHPRGAIAFLFEDVSAMVARDRQHNVEAKVNQSILDELSDGVAIIQPSGLVTLANTKLKELFGKEFYENMRMHGIPDQLENVIGVNAAAFWLKLRAYMSSIAHSAPWEHSIADQSGIDLLVNVSALPDGSTLIIFKSNTSVTVGPGLLTVEDSNSVDALNLDSLKDMLRQRDISLDQSGFYPAVFKQYDLDNLRRILWYLAISASDNCRAGGRISLSSIVEGQFTRLSCSVSKLDLLDDVHENFAASQLKQLVEQPDAKYLWSFENKLGSIEVSLKRKQPLKLSAH